MRRGLSFQQVEALRVGESDVVPQSVDNVEKAGFTLPETVDNRALPIVGRRHALVQSAPFSRQLRLLALP